ncbi:MAG: M16 family metallopeptidase [Oscillospiraceae bacterium]
MFFSRITDRRFKTNRISVSLFTDFEALPRADCALAAYALSECCALYPDYSKLSAALLDLYDASISTATTSRWGMRCTEIIGSALDDRYALSGEKLERELAQLMCECLFRPKAENGAFDEKVTEIMRAELIDAIDSVINDKSRYAAFRAAKTAFVGEPDELAPSGTHEEAEKVTAQSAFAAYREILETARVEIFAAGCSDFAETEEIFAREFSAINRRCAITELGCQPSVLKKEPAYVEDEFDMQQAILRMYFKAPELADFEANFLLARILGGMTTSRFFTNIREKQSLCYYCSSFIDRSKRTLTCYAGIEPKNKKRTEGAILKELRDICENGVTEEEILQAKLELKNQYRTIYDSASALALWYLTQLPYEKFLTPEEFSESLELVTAERIRDAARMYSLDTVYTLSGKDDEE